MSRDARARESDSDKSHRGLYICALCDYVYDPAAGDRVGGVAAGTRFDDLPEDWVCPVCGADKCEFSPFG